MHFDFKNKQEASFKDFEVYWGSLRICHKSRDHRSTCVYLPIPSGNIVSWGNIELLCQNNWHWVMDFELCLSNCWHKFQIQAHQSILSICLYSQFHSSSTAHLLIPIWYWDSLGNIEQSRYMMSHGWCIGGNHSMYSLIINISVNWRLFSICLQSCYASSSTAHVLILLVLRHDKRYWILQSELLTQLVYVWHNLQCCWHSILWQVYQKCLSLYPYGQLISAYFPIRVEIKSVGGMLST
jgi:hypothetical protein